MVGRSAEVGMPYSFVEFLSRPKRAQLDQQKGQWSLCLCRFNEVVRWHDLKHCGDSGEEEIGSERSDSSEVM